jgi:hypothetical protein
VGILDLNRASLFVSISGLATAPQTYGSIYLKSKRNFTNNSIEMCTKNKIVH